MLLLIGPVVDSVYSILKLEIDGKYFCRLTFSDHERSVNSPHKGADDVKLNTSLSPVTITLPTIKFFIFGERTRILHNK